MTATRQRAVVSPDEVLTKAVLRASDHLGLTQRELAGILGLSEASLSRLASGKKLLAVRSKEGELALLFVRIYRSLDALVGGDEQNRKLWLRSENRYFEAIPLEMMQRIRGLVDVAGYLDTMRGKT